MNKEKYSLLALRVSLGFIFLWAFVDKVFGLGFGTASEKAWIHGGSPTLGFLTNATRGPFAELFQSLAGVAVVDWLFMIGLLCIGVSLLANKYIRVGCVAGSVLLFLMYLAVLPPENNPLIDEHIVYIAALAVIATQSKKY